MTEIHSTLIERARGNILRIADSLERKHLSPSLYMLTIGMPYRREIEFNKAANERNLERGIPGYEEFRTEFYQSYDFYSGPNLAAVASYQAKRENIVGIPEENTAEYEDYVKLMGRLGKRMKELIDIEGPESIRNLAHEHFMKKISAKS
ncbi:MAG: hypothetical protein NTV98_01880 [Candidatus Roizmanbacteria bacterium]|nr:hypothetical protein [Candidatus Roizmanbacteria bacterium]